MIALCLVVVAALSAWIVAPASAQQPDAALRLKCALIGGDLSEPAEIIAYKRCLATALPPNAPAPPTDAHGCLPGLAHLRVNPDDIVCVTPARAAEIRLESLAAIGRFQPGSDRCQQGFVWRDATPGDHACVSPGERRRAAEENARAFDSFAFASATTRNLCPYLNPAGIARDFGFNETPEVQSTGSGDCKVIFPTPRALVEIDLIPRTQFGFRPATPYTTPIGGLGEKAVFDATPGSDGLPTQSLFVLLADTALTIQVTRAPRPNADWAVAQARALLRAIAAQDSKQP